MPSCYLELPRPVTPLQVDTLRRDLAPFGRVEEPPAKSMDFESVALVISLAANVLQGAGVLVEWLKAVPHGNRAVIRLVDGRTLRVEADGLDAFRAALQAALQEM